jgi:FkbM family methyltransferase
MAYGVLTLKRFISNLICCPVIGRFLGWLWDDHMRSKGLSIDTTCAAIGGRTKAEVFWGIYEGAEMRMLRRHFIPDLPVIELGSGIGVTSSIIAKKLNPSLKLVCVEANPRLIDSIKKNISANADGCSSVVINAAVDYSIANGRVVKLQIGRNHLLSRVSMRSGDGYVDVPSIQLRAILSEHIDGPMQLVMDIEGAEVGLIRRDGESLNQCVQIVAELHSTEFEGKYISADEICRELCQTYGFDVIDRRGMVFVLRRQTARLHLWD